MERGLQLLVATLAAASIRPKSKQSIEKFYERFSFIKRKTFFDRMVSSISLPNFERDLLGPAKTTQSITVPTLFLDVEGTLLDERSELTTKCVATLQNLSSYYELILLSNNNSNFTSSIINSTRLRCFGGIFQKMVGSNVYAWDMKQNFHRDNFLILSSQPLKFLTSPNELVVVDHKEFLNLAEKVLPDISKNSVREERPLSNFLGRAQRIAPFSTLQDYIEFQE